MKSKYKNADNTEMNISTDMVIKACTQNFGCKPT